MQSKPHTATGDLVSSMPCVWKARAIPFKHLLVGDQASLACPDNMVRAKVNSHQEALELQHITVYL